MPVGCSEQRTWRCHFALVVAQNRSAEQSHSTHDVCPVQPLLGEVFAPCRGPDVTTDPQQRPCNGLAAPSAASWSGGDALQATTDSSRTTSRWSMISAVPMLPCFPRSRSSGNPRGRRRAPPPGTTRAPQGPLAHPGRLGAPPTLARALSGRWAYSGKEIISECRLLVLEPARGKSSCRVAVISRCGLGQLYAKLFAGASGRCSAGLEGGCRARQGL